MNEPACRQHALTGRHGFSVESRTDAYQAWLDTILPHQRPSWLTRASRGMPRGVHRVHLVSSVPAAQRADPSLLGAVARTTTGVSSTANPPLGGRDQERIKWKVGFPDAAALRSSGATVSSCSRRFRRRARRPACARGASRGRRASIRRAFAIDRKPATTLWERRHRAGAARGWPLREQHGRPARRSQRSDALASSRLVSTRTT